MTLMSKQDAERRAVASIAEITGHEVPDHVSAENGVPWSLHAAARIAFEAGTRHRPRPTLEARLYLAAAAWWSMLAGVNAATALWVTLPAVRYISCVLVGLSVLVAAYYFRKSAAQ